MDFSFLERMVDDERAILYARDINGYYVWVNDTYDRELPLGRDQVLGKTNRDLYGDQARNWEVADGFAIAANDFLVTAEDFFDPSRKAWRKFVSTKLRIRYRGIPYIIGVSIEITSPHAAAYESTLGTLRAHLISRMDEIDHGP